MKRWGQAVFVVCGLLLSAGCAEQSSVQIVADMDAAEEIRKKLQSADTGAPEESAAAPMRTGWATLAGQFKIEGTPPPPPQLTVNSDLGICAPGGKAVFSDALHVDEASQGIANVVIFARKVDAENIHESQRPGANTEQVVFDQKNCLFQTRLLGVQLSQPVHMTNSDPTGHNTNIPLINFNVTIAANGSTVYQFKEEQPLPLKASCSIHPWMTAFVLPREDGYFAVTKPDGTFEIPNLPAGVPVEFQVWHELAGNVDAVTVDGQPRVWKTGRFEETLAADETKNLTVTVAATAFRY